MIKMNEKKIFVSIIIVNFNGLNVLKDCLKSLQSISYKENEIILVDNNSTDHSNSFVQENYPHVKIIKLDKNYGFAKANNIGAKKAKGEYFLFLNNDTIVHPDFLEKLVSTANSDKEIAICQPLLLRSDNSVDSSGDFIDIHGRSYQRKIVTNIKNEILSARGAALLVKKNIFWELDGFDEKFFFAFEDIDMGWRAWIYGYKVFLVPDSIVIHKGGQSISHLGPLLSFHSIKNNIILRYTNFDGKYMPKSILFFFIDNFFKKIFGKSFLKDIESTIPIPSFSIIFKSLRWILQNQSYLREKRKQVSLKRQRNTQELEKMGLITK